MSWHPKLFIIILKSKEPTHLGNSIRRRLFVILWSATLKRIFSVVIFDVVTTLPCSSLIFNSLIISSRRYAGILLLSFLFWCFHILTNTKFKYVTSTYYHSWHLVFEYYLLSWGYWHLVYAFISSVSNTRYHLF